MQTYHKNQSRTRLSVSLTTVNRLNYISTANLFLGVFFVYCFSQSPIYGLNLLGSLGKSDARRMFFKSKKNINTLSKPIPPPACGAHP